MDPTSTTSAATDLAANCSIEPPFVAGKDTALRVVVGVTCTFSILGSLLIILSYTLFKDLRTTARLILLHLSLTDFGVAFSNLFGDWFKFYQYASCSASHPNAPLLTRPSYNQLCIAQAFFAHFSTISSVLWTMMLAAYMYSVVTKIKEGPNSNRLFLICSYLFCYGMPLAVNIWMVLTGKLGFAPYDTSGWCGTIVTDPHYVDKHHRLDYMAAIVGYDLWIVLTIVFIVVIYVSLHFYVRKEKKASSTFQDLIANIDYKFIAIPMAFVLLRVWSLLDNIFFLYLRHIFNDNHHLKEVLGFFTGIGDSGQGAVNGVIFVIFTRTVRLRVWALFCWCSPRRRRRKKEEDAKKGLLRGDNDISDDSDSGQYDGSSSPMRIDRSPSKQQQQHMGSMATTTSINISISDQSLSSYETA